MSTSSVINIGSLQLVPVCPVPEVTWRPCQCLYNGQQKLQVLHKLHILALTHSVPPHTVQGLPTHIHTAQQPPIGPYCQKHAHFIGPCPLQGWEKSGLLGQREEGASPEKEGYSWASYLAIQRATVELSRKRLVDSLHS